MMIRFSFVILMLGFFSGCPDESGDDNNVYIPNNNKHVKNNSNNKGSNNSNNSNNNSTAQNNTTQTIGNTDQGMDYGKECDEVVCEDPSQRCVRGSCISKTLKIACFNVQDLGVLPIDKAKSASGNTQGFADSTVSKCVDSTNGFSGPENVIRFQVEKDAKVNISLSSTDAVDWVMDLRKDCHKPESSLICRDPETLSISAKVGEEYFLVVEPLEGIDEGEFKVDFTFTELKCGNPGENTCDGENLSRCIKGGAATKTLKCPAGCAKDSCKGDTCDSAIEVTASQSFSGDSDAFHSNLNFKSQPTCSPEGGAGLDSKGSEMVLSFPNLKKGQSVIVDTSVNDQNDNAIFVTQDCSDQKACVASADLGEILTWTVPTDGSYFIIIDKMTENTHPFHYTVDIQ